jgi:threonine/homoserine/homoserine lactone efflux protein
VVSTLAELIDQRFVTFLAVFALLIVTPGPDTAMVIRSALSGGWRAASFTALGIGVGTIAWAAAAVLGVAVVIKGSPIAFTILQLGGAVYLAYLGARSLVGALRSNTGQVVTAGPAGRQSHAEGRAFRQGLASNLLNAKTGPFFLTVMPQFVEPGDPASRWFAMLLAYEVMLLAWLNLYGYVVSRAARAFVGDAMRRALEALTGLVLISFGLRLVLERR